MRRPFVAGNWKMNTTAVEAVELVREMLPELIGFTQIDRVLCPPFISLYPVNELIKDTDIFLGAQNMYFKEKGAYTGEVSPLMLNNLCRYVILGHSERRQYFAETDEIINEKLRVALNHCLLPIFCIGESLLQNEAGKTSDVLATQINNGLKNIQINNNFVIAYEPIWAIGTGKAATGRQAGQTIGFIRQALAVMWNKQSADMVRILYGGSVTAANIEEFMREPQIDGALVGGASLKASEFLSIVQQTAIVKSAS